MDKKQKILNFLRKNELMVLSYLGDGKKPQSAVVGFSETEDLEIVFGTFVDYRKHEYLLKNRQVSLVIGWGLEEKVTIQYEGVVVDTSNGDIENLRRLHILKNPKREKYVNDPKERMFKIKPKWIRYSDLSGDEEDIFEISFAD